MQALKLPAIHGWFWIKEGFLLFRKRPIHLSFFVMSYLLLITLVSNIPLFGTASVILMPPFAVGLMNVCRAIDQNELIEPGMLFSGFKTNLNVLLKQGLIYLAITTMLLGIALLTDDGTPFLKIDQESNSVSINSISLTEISIIIMLMLVMMANWYAPVLSAWHNLPAGKALFFSFIACLRNWRSFIVYFVSSLLILVTVGIVIGMLASVSNSLVSMFVLPLIMFIFLPTIYASFYISYREVFVVIDESV